MDPCTSTRTREGRRPVGNQRVSRKEEPAVRRGDGPIRARLCRPSRARPRSTAGGGARRQRGGAAGALSQGLAGLNEEKADEERANFLAIMRARYSVRAARGTCAGLNRPK